MCGSFDPMPLVISSAPQARRTTPLPRNMPTGLGWTFGLCRLNQTAKTSSQLGHVIEVTESFEPNLVRGAICSLMAGEQMHHDGYRVALCGEGADELFCGYPPLELAFFNDEIEGRAFRDECLQLMNR